MRYRCIICCEKGRKDIHIRYPNGKSACAWNAGVVSEFVGDIKRKINEE